MSQSVSQSVSQSGCLSVLLGRSAKLTHLRDAVPANDVYNERTNKDVDNKRQRPLRHANERPNDAGYKQTAYDVGHVDNERTVFRP